MPGVFGGFSRGVNATEIFLGSATFLSGPPATGTLTLSVSWVLLVLPRHAPNVVDHECCPGLYRAIGHETRRSIGGGDAEQWRTIGVG